VPKVIPTIAAKVALPFGPRSSRLGARLQLATMVLMGVMLMVSSWLAREASSEQRKAEYWQEHAVDVLGIVSDIRVAAISIRRGERGYLLTQDVTYLRPYEEARTTLAMSVPRLGRAVIDNPVQVRRFRLLEEQLRVFQAQAASTVAAQQNGNHDAAVALVRTGQGRTLTNEVLTDLDEFEAIERQLLATRKLRADEAAARSEDFQQVLTVSAIMLLILGGLASQALRGALLREEAMRAELNRVATTDELTGLANRRELFSSLDRMIAASRRSKRPVAVAVLDIDRFKLVNDTYGHPAGDEVIRRVAQMALEMMREQDMVGRLGGEEFLIAFPDATVDQAMAACDRLRQGIAALPLLLPSGKGLSVTVSAGVAMLNADDDRTRLIGRADEALYVAKKAGRDQVKLAA